MKLEHAINWLIEIIDRLSSLSACSVILGLSLAVKLGYILVLGGGLNTFPAEGSDVAFYDTAARNLLSTGIYGNVLGQPTTGMPPGQSYFLALLYAVSNYSIAFTKLAHVGLLTAVAVLAYFTGKVLVSHSVGFWTGVLVAIDPAMAYLSGTFLSDALFIFLMVIGIYLLVRRKSKNNYLYWIAAGICFALAGLTRNQGWLFALALWLGALVTWGRLISIRAATVILLATVATIAPWTIRSLQVTGQFVLIASNGGLNLWSGNNPEFLWRQPMPMSGGIYAIPPGLNGSEIDNYYRRQAVDWISSHPIDFIVNGVRKVIVLYSFDPLSTRPEVAGLYRLAGIFPYGIVLPFIFLGLMLSLKDPRFHIILWYLLFTTALAFVFFGDSRIRAPIQPYLYLFGVLGVQAVMHWVNRNRARAAIPFGEKAQ